MAWTGTASLVHSHPAEDRSGPWMQKLRVPYFDEAEIELDDLAEIGDVRPESSGGEETLKAFLNLSAADRVADSRHVFAYYRDFHEAVGGEDFLDEEMGVPETPEAIWKHVRPKQAYLVAGPDDDHCYLVVTCDCDWEIEHGLSMVWRDGKILNKVGGDDGHVTNAYAYDDDALKTVVYPGIDQSFRTFLQP